MARTDRAYRKMMRRKTMLCAEKDYRDILLRDCQEQARKKTDAYRTQLMRELYTAHPDWIPAEEAGKIVFDSRMAQFDADMAFVRKQASTRAAKAISKDPACAEREEEKLQQLQKEHEELRNQYSCRLQREISAQLTDMPGDGAVNCTPFVRQYDILSNKWGDFICQRAYRTNGIHRSSRNT